MGKEGYGAEILIVDNDERIVELVAWFLAKRGYRVRSAPTFSEARERIAERRPALMLSDVDMGAESALEELPRMLAGGVLPPTLVVSGYLDAPTVARLEQLPPVLGTLAKPFDFQDLELRVRDCLQRAAAAPTILAARREAGEAGDGWIEIAPARSSGAGSLH